MSWFPLRKPPHFTCEGTDRLTSVVASFPKLSGKLALGGFKSYAYILAGICLCDESHGTIREKSPTKQIQARWCFLVGIPFLVVWGPVVWIPRIPL